MARQRLVLKNTALFSDPANLSWERYVIMQARERERYLAERATIPADALNYKNVSPRYLANAVDQFANNYYSELSATHYVATAAANAPFDELKKSALFQLAEFFLQGRSNFFLVSIQQPGHGSSRDSRIWVLYTHGTIGSFNLAGLPPIEPEAPWILDYFLA